MSEDEVEESMENEELFIAIWLSLSAIPFILGMLPICFESIGILSINDTVIVQTLAITGLFNFFVLIGTVLLFEYHDNEFKKKVERIVRNMKKSMEKKE